MLLQRRQPLALEETLTMTSTRSDVTDSALVSRQSVRKPWDKAVKAIGLDPAPIFHGLRRRWKTNARRSGMDPEIREAILGHADKTSTVRERYGAISDEELRNATNLMTFEHGETEIWLSGKK